MHDMMRPGADRDRDGQEDQEEQATVETKTMCTTETPVTAKLVDHVILDFG